MYSCNCFWGKFEFWGTNFLLDASKPSERAGYYFGIRIHKYHHGNWFNGENSGVPCGDRYLNQNKHLAICIWRLPHWSSRFNWHKFTKTDCTISSLFWIQKVANRFAAFFFWNYGLEEILAIDRKKIAKNKRTSTLLWLNRLLVNLQQKQKT